MGTWLFAVLCAATSVAAEGVSPPGVEAPAESPSFYRDARSVGTQRETEPPRYVRTLSATDWPALRDLSWLDIGLDYRMRFEYRDGDLRRSVGVVDTPILTRTRAYIGVHDIVDPVRFYVELEDARRFHSRFADDTRDLNKAELIQYVGELYFKNLLGAERPVRLQYGRMWMEYLDRRLIANNAWRNTTNTFEGFRAILGQARNDWQVDLFAVHPVIRDVYEFDQVDNRQLFFGVIGDWRRWSDVVTLQPYYLGLKEESNGSVTKEIHTVGLRGYGVVGATGFDYDVDYVGQFGTVGALDHRAVMLTTELGYTWPHRWKPRLSGFVGYASGDDDPDDGTNERFDRLFGFARPWSANDYFAPENLIAPKLRLESVPRDRVLLEVGYSAYFLASATDAWVGGNGLRDRTGRSGNFIGHEIDLRARFKLPYVDTTVGYAWFVPGEFVRNTGRSSATNFFYVEIAPRLFN